VQSTLYDSDSSARRAVDAQWLSPGTLQLRDGREIRNWPLDKLVIADPISGCPAVVELPNGARLEVEDSMAFYDALALLESSQRTWVNSLEQKWPVALLCLVVSIALVAWAVIDGIPFAARMAASAMPASANAAIGQEGLRMLDQFMFEPSTLDAQSQQSVQERFDDIVATIGDDSAYELTFRSSQTVGPNAFALPNGVVVITDDLIALSEDDREIAAVLAHEVGHVVHRHALRGLIQNSVAAGLLVAISGDIGSAANLGAGLPAIFVNAAYTRDFEREADEVAFQYLEARDIDPVELGELLMRIEEHYGREPGRFTLLDTHPATRERLDAARQH